MIKLNKPFGVFDRKKKRYVEFFEYPIQAENYIERRLKGSRVFVVVDKRKKNG